jgi:class 3 adenylate cyclase
MAPDVERKLAAILSADVVGYSRLMAEDEAATIRTLTDYREEIAMRVRQHRGRVVDTPGDNLLAEFPTALDAVHLALWCFTAWDVPPPPNYQLTTLCDHFAIPGADIGCAHDALYDARMTAGLAAEILGRMGA